MERAKKNKVIKFFENLSKCKPFKYFISLNIILNTVILSQDKYPEDPYLNMIFEKTNIVFFTIFLLEMVIKITGYGFKKYFKDSFNSFDCIIVLISCVDVILQNTIASTGNSAISALRAFRLLRVFKLAKSWKKF